MKEGYLNNIFDFPIDEEHFSSEMIESDLENFENEGILKTSNPFTELNYNFRDFLPKLFPQQNSSFTNQKNEFPSKAAAQEEGIGYMQNYFPIKSASAESFEDTSCSNAAKSVSSHSSKKNIEILFKIEKNETKQKEMQLLKQKTSRKSSDDDGEDREGKLSRNRISAKKSRQKKKAYINSLETKYMKMEAELKSMKKLLSENKNSITSKVNEIEHKEKEYFTLLAQGQTGKNSKQMQVEENKIKFFHNKMQSSLVVELYRDMIKSLVPLDIKFFEKKCNSLSDIYKFDTIDEFLDLLVQNQYVLNESYNFQFASEATNSFPFQVYMFYEHLKKMTLDFKENVFQVRK
jgi:hypothetical protein